MGRHTWGRDEFLVHFFIVKECLLSGGVAIHSTSLYVYDGNLQGIFPKLKFIPIIYLKLHIKVKQNASAIGH